MSAAAILPERSAASAHHGVGAPAGVVRRLFHGDGGKRNGLRAAPDDLLRRGDLAAEVVEDRIGQFEAVFRRVEEIGGDHRVAAEAP